MAAAVDRPRPEQGLEQRAVHVARHEDHLGHDGLKHHARAMPARASVHLGRHRELLRAEHRDGDLGEEPNTGLAADAREGRVLRAIDPDR